MHAQLIKFISALLAQLDRVTGYEPVGQGFESLTTRQNPRFYRGFCFITTLKAAAGILDFSEGDILIDGVSVRQDAVACKKKLAFLPDNPDLYELKF